MSQLLAWHLEILKLLRHASAKYRMEAIDEKLFQSRGTARGRPACRIKNRTPAYVSDITCFIALS
jgi:hypothetical protein